MEPGYIAVEGPIGAGKTSAALRLAERLGFEPLLESPGSNPFLPGFYREPVRYALPTQLSFLLQRVEQLDGLGAAARGRGTVADFMLDKDPLFAQLNLQGAELELYRALYGRLAPRSLVPDCVVYLEAPPEVLLERVRQRRNAYERGVTLDYLQRLSDAYARWLRGYTAAPILIVNSERLNFVDRDDDFELLLHRVRSLEGPREYFGFG